VAEKEVQVKLKYGLQAQAAALFVQKASSYVSDIFIDLDGKKVNGKSIMGLMSLAIAPNQSFILSAEGNDEEEAIEALAAYIQNEE